MEFWKELLHWSPEQLDSNPVSVHYVSFRFFICIGNEKMERVRRREGGRKMGRKEGKRGREEERKGKKFIIIMNIDCIEQAQF